MKLIAQTLLIMLCAVSLPAAAIEGNIQINYTNSPFKSGVFTQEFGDVVKAKCAWYAGDFFGQETVFAGVTVTNTGSKPMFFNYYVAFYDKDKKLVGASGQGSYGKKGLKPGEEEQMGSCLITLPKGRYKNIVSYQAVIYESDQTTARN